MENLLQYLLIGGGGIMLGLLIMKLQSVDKHKTTYTCKSDGIETVRCDECDDIVRHSSENGVFTQDCQCKRNKPVLPAQHITGDAEIDAQRLELYTIDTQVRAWGADILSYMHDDTGKEWDPESYVELLMHQSKCTNDVCRCKAIDLASYHEKRQARYIPKTKGVFRAKGVKRNTV